MQALKISDLRLIAGFHQRLEPGLDQLGNAAAQHGLLAEEIGLGLFFEGSLDDAGPGAADALGICQRLFLGFAGSILVDRDDGRRAVLLDIKLA